MSTITLTAQAGTNSGKEVIILKAGNGATIATLKDTTVYVEPTIAISVNPIELKEAIQGIKPADYLGIKPAGVAAIARSLGMNVDDLKAAIDGLLGLKYNSLKLFENSASQSGTAFNTRNAVNAMEGLAAGASTSFSGVRSTDRHALSGLSATMASMEMPPITIGDVYACVQSLVLVGIPLSAASLDLPSVGGNRRQYGGASNNEEEPAPSKKRGRGSTTASPLPSATVSAPALAAAAGAGTSATSKRGRGRALPSIAERIAEVANSGSATVEELPLTEEAAVVTAEQVEVMTGALAAVTLGMTVGSGSAASSGSGGGSASVAASTAAEALTVQVGARLAEINAAAAASPAGQLPGGSLAVAPPAAPGGGGGPLALASSTPKTFTDIKNALLGHLLEWMNANGAFIQAGKDEIMRKLYDFATSERTKRTLQKGAKIASIAAGGIIATSTAAAFIAPGAVLNFYLLMFSYLTGFATTIIGSPLHILSSLIIKFLFYLPDSYKFKLFNQIAGQVGGLGSSVGIQTLITSIFPNAAALPGFSQGMFTIDLAIGAYILFNLHRYMGAMSPFTLAGKVTAATFGPLLDSIKSAAFRLSTDVRFCVDYLKGLTTSLCTISVTAYNKTFESIQRVGPTVVSSTKSVGRGIKRTAGFFYKGITQTAGFGNKVFWLLVKGGVAVCNASSELLNAGSAVLKMPYSSVKFPILTSGQEGLVTPILNQIIIAGETAGIPPGSLPSAPKGIVAILDQTSAEALPSQEGFPALLRAASTVDRIQQATEAKRLTSGGMVDDMELPEDTALPAAPENSASGGRAAGGASAIDPRLAHAAASFSTYTPPHTNGGAAETAGAAAPANGGPGGTGLGGSGGAAPLTAQNLGGGRRRRHYKKTHKRRNHKRRVHKTKKHPKRR
jgi:hypothetical protein